MDNQKYGVIHEVGDMGLGFTSLPEKEDQETLRKHEEERNDRQRQCSNQDKK